MGHRSLATTARYLRIATTKVCSTTSPLDLLPRPVAAEPEPALPQHFLAAPDGSPEVRSGGYLPPLRCRLSAAARRFAFGRAAPRDDGDRGLPHRRSWWSSRTVRPVRP